MSLGSLKSSILQAFPPKPNFTHQNVPDLSGKVCIVTGSNTGVGKEVAQMLYAKNARVYVASRSKDKALKAIEDIKAAVPKTVTSGQLVFLPLDLADLARIQTTVDEFLSKESELHLLFNNAGIGFPTQGSKSAQGYELQLGVNCLGPFLLTKLLTPILTSTAKTSPPNTVRVVWASSSANEGITIGRGFMDNLDYHKDESAFYKYCMSKIGNYFYGAEFGARHKADGVISVSLNPGNLDSDFWRTFGPVKLWLMRRFVLYPTIYGTYVYAFAAFSPEITIQNTGSFVAPWSRLWQQSSDKTDAVKNGDTEAFWNWSEAQVKQYV